jgi:hypothetical protein
MNRVRLYTTALAALILLSFGQPLLSWSAESLGDLSLLEVSPRIVTPNGDNLNDLVFFKFSDSIVGIPLETNVVDINGGKISDLREKSGMDDVLTWDGKDSGGRDVPSGIYIYSIKLGGHQATGTVVVAR